MVLWIRRRYNPHSQIVSIGWLTGFIRPVAALAAVESTATMLSICAARVGLRSDLFLIHCAMFAADRSSMRAGMIISVVPVWPACRISCAPELGVAILEMRSSSILSGRWCKSSNMAEKSRSVNHWDGS